MEMDQLQHIAALIGEPSRVKMLWSLMDGKAYTATELACFSDLSPQSASMHLGKLVQSAILKVISQGRHRYYSFASPEVATALEALSNLVPQNAAGKCRSTSDIPFRHCRTCYDHMAGNAGVAITDGLLKLQYLSQNALSFNITAEGEVFFGSLGIDISLLQSSKRPIARCCLDWSERRYHLAGSLGAALLSHMIGNDWMRRVKNSRSLLITSKGRSEVYNLLRVQI